MIEALQNSHALVLSAMRASVAAKSVNPDDVTPGVVGFIAIFLIAVAVVFLVIDMTRRIRRVRYRAEIAEKLDAEQAAAEAAARAAAELETRPSDEPE